MRDAQPIAVTPPMQLGAGQIGHTLSGRSQPRSRTPIATIRDTETAIFTQYSSSQMAAERISFVRKFALS
jgi:hypothetical protein